MGYDIVGVNGQYNSYGAEACIRVNEECDLTPEIVDEVIDIARDEGATFEDDGGEENFVVELPDRPQEVYTEGALRRSLKPYLVQSA